MVTVKELIAKLETMDPDATVVTGEYHEYFRVYRYPTLDYIESGRFGHNPATDQPGFIADSEPRHVLEDEETAVFI